jgi:hypothetical protein
VKSLSIKLKRITESVLGDILKSEMENMSTLDLTLFKDEYNNSRHTDKRMEMLMYGIFPEAKSINQKLQQLHEIIETTQLTLGQIFDEEFPGTGRSDGSFGVLLSKLIAQKLGAPKDSDDKTALATKNIPVLGMFFEKNIPVLGMLFCLFNPRRPSFSELPPAARTRRTRCIEQGARSPRALDPVTCKFRVIETESVAFYCCVK